MKKIWDNRMKVMNLLSKIQKVGGGGGEDSTREQENEEVKTFKDFITVESTQPRKTMEGRKNQEELLSFYIAMEKYLTVRMVNNYCS